MACGECGDPRGLCRCSVVAADSSVIVTGTGEPGDPYQISAPGAGAGTRNLDRAGIYAQNDGSYPVPLPDSYPHFDFYGEADPSTVPGYTPGQFDGWYRLTPNAPIALRAAITIENTVGTTLAVNIPIGVDADDVAVLIVGAGSASSVVAPPEWSHIAHGNSIYTGAFIRRLTSADAGAMYVFSGVAAPYGGYLLIYSGVSAGLLDVNGISGSSGEALVSSLNLGSLSVVTPGSLMISAVTVNSTTARPVPPGSLSAVVGTPSTLTVPITTVASQLLPNAGPSVPLIWTHTPPIPNQQYSGIAFALRPAYTLTYFLRVNGRWVSSGSSGSGLSVRDFTATIGDGQSTVLTVVHPLGTTDVLVECVNIATGQTCFPVIRRINDDAVSLDFGDTVPGIWTRRVLITRVGANQGVN